MKLKPWLAPGILLAGLTLYGQQPAPRVALNVVAVDSNGNPVTDLAASDFTVLDNGSPQQIVSLHLKQADGPPPVVILFDLMNSNLDSRGAISNTLKASLARVPANEPTYLYLLLEDGSLYPVHGIESGDSTGWPQNAEQLLDAALHKVSQLKPQDLRAASPVALVERFNITCKALDAMRARMATLRGAKELLWISYGIPSSLHMQGTGWWDGGPFLREIGSRFVQSGIAIYTADPGMNLAVGVLNRDALDILTGATGGRAFPTIDVSRAVAQIETDARTKYSLEYQPPAKNWDGKYHKLRVTVARKGIRLQTERGYFAVGS